MNAMQSLVETLNAGSYSNIYLIGLAFAAGLLVSFTPCIYVMIPVTAGILNTQRSRSFLRSFILAVTYILGIATVHASLGYLSATTSVLFGSWMANPYIIGLVTAFFIYLAGSMLDLYDLYIPQFLMQTSEIQSNGSLLSTYLLGMLSGTIASPCLTPALAVLLGIAAKQANPIMGFVTLFSFSLGMGTLLLLVGTFSSTLTLLPRAGEWMNDLKKALGFGMLMACVFFVQPFLPHNADLLLHGLVALAGAGLFCYHGTQRRSSLILGIIFLLITLGIALIGFKDVLGF